MERANEIRLGQHQQVVVALDVTGMRGKPRPPKVSLRQIPFLDHRAHGTIQHEDPPVQPVFQFFNSGCRTHYAIHILRLL